MTELEEIIFYFERIKLTTDIGDDIKWAHSNIIKQIHKLSKDGLAIAEKLNQGAQNG